MSSSPIPQPTANDGLGSDGIPPAVLWTLLAAGHVTAAILLTMAFGLCVSTFLLTSAVGLEICIWQLPNLSRHFWESFAYHRENNFHLDRLESFFANNSRRLPDRNHAANSTSPSNRVESEVFQAQIVPQTQTLESSTPTPVSQQPDPASAAAHSSRTTASEASVAKPPVTTPPVLRERTYAESIPPKPSFSFPNLISQISRRAGPSTLNEQGAVFRAGAGDFFGRGTVINLGRVAIRDPLVYATAGTHSFHVLDASLIDGSLPVAPPGTNPIDRLPYWPSYSDATPQQRARYLDWLGTNRCDPRIELGYVFIYFYGLERRVIVDQAEHIPIIDELLRLRKIYCSSRSFDRYSAALLWLTIALAGRISSVSEQVLDAAISSTSRWDDGLLAQCLAYFQERGLPLPPGLALQVAKVDPRTPSSIVVRRQESRFKELFLKKYTDRFNAGMVLKASKRIKPLHYHAASATLNGPTHFEQTSRALLEIPDVLGITSQFKPLVDIWEQCVDELRAYDKASQASGGTQTAEAYEALPTSLRTGEHPEYDLWFRLWEQKANAGTLPVVSIESLAALKGFGQRGTLLKTQCVKLLSTADCLGIGIEPDARLSNKNYRWDEQVVLYFRESDGEENPATYQAAALLLELGVYIASADDSIDSEELTIIAKHLEDQFTLSPDEVKRLECRRQLLCLNPPKDVRISATIRKKLTKQQRRLVGEFLVGIAAADQVISPREMTSLRRLYTQLDLDTKDLEALLAPLATTTPVQAPKQTVIAKPEEFRLDLLAVSRIMNETKEVARILQDAMDVEEEDDSSENYSPTRTVNLPNRYESTATAVPETSAAIVVSGTDWDLGAAADHLDRRYQPFLKALLTKSDWSLRDARELSMLHHVMLNGAIEAINEWSQEQFGDWLIEDGDPLVIHSNILSK
ncbi:TerB N-terminal domain-containing protein [Anatilimnocola sp. NA78]|uniref:tellurite resistance TerB family protein n=1 Tax=Anatilimnocola sp. NA78 TaxID=3415683 RepID=UPI003CE4F369